MICSLCGACSPPVQISEKSLAMMDQAMDVNYLSIPGLPDNEELRCKVKIRYHHPGMDAVIKSNGNGAINVVFDEPVKAVTPGQSASIL